MHEYPYSQSKDCTVCCPPTVDQLAGQAARRGQDVGRFIGGPVDRSHHLGIGGQVGVGVRGAAAVRRRRRHRHRRSDLVDVGVVLGRLRRGPGRPVAAGPVVAEGRPQLQQALACIGHQRQAPVLGGVEAGRVESDDSRRLVPEHGPRAGGEILHPRAHGQHDVGVGGHGVGRSAAGDPDGAAVERIAGRQRRAACGCLHHGDSVGVGEGGELRFDQRTPPPAMIRGRSASVSAQTVSSGRKPSPSKIRGRRA